MAAVSVAVPSLFLSLIFARAFFKYHRHPRVAAAFYGSPAGDRGDDFLCCGVLCQAKRAFEREASWTTLLFFLVAFVLFARTKLHPALVLLFFWRGGHVCVFAALSAALIGQGRHGAAEAISGRARGGEPRPG
ncbi:hypothetical protein AB1399_13770, partial [Hydrogenibacillus schlegelii]|uniref:hypothetical protein n=1 Tax=Hydrogenibacillus schlegelii TaxID=1484 RepID=UPI0034A04CDA